LPDFSWYKIPKRENIPNKHIPNIPKWPQNVANGRKMDQMAIKDQHLPLQDPPSVTQNSFFGLKICHLATLLTTPVISPFITSGKNSVACF
jgi:hypothetical protein